MPEPGPSMSARMVRKNLSVAPNSVVLTIPTSHLWKLFLLLPRPAVQKQDNSTTKWSTIQKQKKSISRQHYFFTAPDHIAEIPCSIPWNLLPLPDNLQYFSLISKKSSLNVFLSWHAKFLTWIILSLQKYIKSWSHCWNISLKILNTFRMKFLSPAFSNQSIPLLNRVLHALTVQISQCLAINFYTGFKRIQH